MFRLSHEFHKRHEFRAHVREINDPSRMVTYFARIINFAWHRVESCWPGLARITVNPGPCKHDKNITTRGVLTRVEKQPGLV